MKALILTTCLLLTALVEADLNQPLVPITGACIIAAIVTAYLGWRTEDA